jgi:hypothetical protein
MIKLENYEVVGWEHAIRGMRNPMNSWKHGDSVFKETADTIVLENGLPKPQYVYYDALAIGPSDHNLMKKLRNAGTDHRKFMRMITVYVDITAPLYWWKEFDTYKVGTVANSCSTMHKIHEKEFTLEDFSCEHLLNDWNDTDDCGTYDFAGYIVAEEVLNITIEALNFYRNKYLETKRKPFKEEAKRAPLMKKYWWQMIQLLPSSYNQKRTIMLNYEVLANMYKSRKAHKLDEWREFCKWIEQLPYSELITGEVGEPKTEIAYLCDGEQCDPCNNIDCNHTLDIKHAVNFEKVGDYKYMEMMSDG